MNGVESTLERGRESNVRIASESSELTHAPRPEFAIPYYRGLQGRVSNGTYEQDAAPRRCWESECGLLVGRRPVVKPESGEYFQSLPWAQTNEEVEYIEYELSSGLIRSRKLLFNGMLISRFDMRCYSMKPSATQC